MMIGQFVNISNTVASTLFVDANNGNDSIAQSSLTAKGGVPAHPFLTVPNAVAAFQDAVTNYGWTSGVLRIGPGTFNQGTARVIFPSGLAVVGSGKYATILASNNTATTAFSAASDVQISDLTMSTVVGDAATRICFGWRGGTDGGSNYPSGIQNVVLRNCYLAGDSDILDFVTLTGGGCTMSVYDCSFAANFDTATGSAGNWTIDAWNCDFNAAGPDLEGDNITRGFSCPGGTLSNQAVFRFYGCKFTATNGNGTTYGFNVSAGHTTVELHACRIISSASSGTVYDLFNSNGAGTILSVDEATQYATSSGTITPLSAGVTGSAPSTNSFSAPANVYGSATALLGSPRAWKSVTVGGTTYSVPLF